MLCSQFKTTILIVPPEKIPIDPYIMIIKQAVKLSQTSLPSTQLELLCTTAALKVLDAATRYVPFILLSHFPKHKIMEQWFKRWNWDLNKPHYFNLYIEWSNQERLNLSDEILKMLVSAYIHIFYQLIQHYLHQMDPQNKYSVYFTAHFLTHQTGLASIIKVLPTQIHQRHLTGQMILENDPPIGFWRLYAPGTEDEGLNSNNLIFSNPRLIKVVTCLIQNQFYQLDYISPLEADGFNLLKNFNLYQSLGDLSQVFPLFDSSLKNQNLRWSTGGHSLVFIILIFQNPVLEDMKKINFILTTGWREIRYFYLTLEDLPSNPNRYLKVARTLFKKAATRPTYFFTTKKPHLKYEDPP